jgi:transcriptional regulator NrdR family protein
MKCPICDGSTGVTKTRPRDGETKVWRRRECEANPDHKFETLERWMPPSFDKVGIRQSGDGQLSGEAFSRERLERDLAQAILRKPGRATDELVRRTADNVVRRLQFQLQDVAQPLSGRERRAHPGLEAAITDAVIADEVENVLHRHRDDMPRVLYALSIRGRQDRPHREGWNSAEDVLRWIYTAYPELAEDLPAFAPSPAAFAWLPTAATSRPKRVLKRSRPNGSQPFRYPQFAASIRRAMLGRNEAEARSGFVAEWVLSRLQGQQVVQSAQLGAGVLEALRRIDDVAYLRWTVLFKRFTDVSDLVEEALSLIAEPSPRLEFRTSPSAAITPSDP